MDTHDDAHARTPEDPAGATDPVAPASAGAASTDAASTAVPDGSAPDAAGPDPAAADSPSPDGSVPDPAAPAAATDDDLSAGAAAGRPAAHAQPARRSGRALWFAGGAAVLAVAAVVVVLVLDGRGEPAAAPTTPPAVTLTNPLPTPVGTPVEREKDTPLQQALPDTVLQWTVASQERTETAEDPLESYRLTYTDGAGGTVVVDVVQTRSVEDAGEASTVPGDDDPEPGTGSTFSEMGVRVGDRTVGSGSLMTGGERGLAVWTNGTTAFRATGPGDEIENFYLAFPL